jgi:hypothetical protein
MDFIDEVTSTSLDEPRKEVSAEIFHKLHDEFAIELFTEDDESFAYRLVQFGVGGPG